MVMWRVPRNTEMPSSALASGDAPSALSPIQLPITAIARAPRSRARPTRLPLITLRLAACSPPTITRAVPSRTPWMNRPTSLPAVAAPPGASPIQLPSMRMVVPPASRSSIPATRLPLIRLRSFSPVPPMLAQAPSTISTPSSLGNAVPSTPNPIVLLTIRAAELPVPPTTSPCPVRPRVLFPANRLPQFSQLSPTSASRAPSTTPIPPRRLGAAARPDRSVPTQFPKKRLATASAPRAASP